MRELVPGFCTLLGYLLLTVCQTNTVLTLSFWLKSLLHRSCTIHGGNLEPSNFLGFVTGEYCEVLVCKFRILNNLVENVNFSQ